LVHASLRRPRRQRRHDRILKISATPPSAPHQDLLRLLRGPAELGRRKRLKRGAKFVIAKNNPKENKKMIKNKNKNLETNFKSAHASGISQANFSSELSTRGFKYASFETLGRLRGLNITTTNSDGKLGLTSLGNVETSK
jgi:hypothetical protein